MQGRKRQVWFGVLVLGFSCLPLAAQNTKATRVEFAQVRPFIQSFETAINREVAAAFPGPFGVQQMAKGFYMPGYGYEFTFLVNVRRGLVNTPFGAYEPDANNTPERRKQLIDGLKEQLLHLLLGAGNGTGKLQKDESVAIIAFFEERDPLNPAGNASKTLILSILKGDLDELANKQDHFNEFKQRVKIVEY